MLNPMETVTLYFFPIQALWVALIVTALRALPVGSLYNDPLMGLFACGGILAAFLYVRVRAALGGHRLLQRAAPGGAARAGPAGLPGGALSSPTTLDGSRKRGPL